MAEFENSTENSHHKQLENQGKSETTIFRQWKSNPGKVNSQWQKQTCGCQGLGTGDGINCKEVRRHFWLEMTKMLFLWFGDKFVKTDQILHLKWWILLHVNYTLMKLIKNILKISIDELEDITEETCQK